MYRKAAGGHGVGEMPQDIFYRNRVPKEAAKLIFVFFEYTIFPKPTEALILINVYPWQMRNQDYFLIQYYSNL